MENNSSQFSLLLPAWLRGTLWAPGVTASLILASHVWSLRDQTFADSSLLRDVTSPPGEPGLSSPGPEVLHMWSCVPLSLLRESLDIISVISSHCCHHTLGVHQCLVVPGQPGTLGIPRGAEATMCPLYLSLFTYIICSHGITAPSPQKE